MIGDMNRNARFTQAILSPLLEAIEAGKDPVEAVRTALDAFPQEIAPGPEHPLQIIIPEGEVTHIRNLHGCVESATKQLSWLKGSLAQQQHLLLSLIDELKSYHNVPAEVPYNLTLANSEGEVTCFVRGDLSEEVVTLSKNKP